MKKVTRLIDSFAEMEDPRMNRCKKHNLTDIVAISICAVLCGADSWDEIESFGISKKKWLKTFLELPNGIPSHDTFNRLFSNLNPDQFETAFSNWVASLIIAVKGEVVAIDGKTIRGAKVNGKSPIHMVSAWACENSIVLGQVKVSEKSNEITAIPELLSKLAIEGCTVTIDAMGCQENIVSKIKEAKAEYVIAVKGNQGSLYEQIMDEFRFSKNQPKEADIDFEHGRIETRKCTVIKEFKHITNQEKWNGLKTIVRMESIREFKNKGKTESATRYYISSLDVDEKTFQKTIRNHWHVENKLHWILDVSFGEDASRKRNGNASQNFSLITKIALNLAKNEKTCKLGVKSKRKKAGWDENYLLTLLGI